MRVNMFRLWFTIDCHPFTKKGHPPPPPPYEAPAPSRTSGSCRGRPAESRGAWGRYTPPRGRSLPAPLSPRREVPPRVPAPRRPARGPSGDLKLPRFPPPRRVDEYHAPLSPHLHSSTCLGPRQVVTY